MITVTYDDSLSAYEISLLFIPVGSQVLPMRSSEFMVFVNNCFSEIATSGNLGVKNAEVFFSVYKNLCPITSTNKFFISGNSKRKTFSKYPISVRRLKDLSMIYPIYNMISDVSIADPNTLSMYYYTCRDEKYDGFFTLNKPRSLLFTLSDELISQYKGDLESGLIDLTEGNLTDESFKIFNLIGVD